MRTVGLSDVPGLAAETIAAIDAATKNVAAYDETSPAVAVQSVFDSLMTIMDDKAAHEWLETKVGIDAVLQIVAALHVFRELGGRIVFIDPARES